MPTMKLRSVPYGTTFTAFGDQFVALDYIGGGVLAIRKETWKNAAFDSNGVNDLRSASIGRDLEAYLNTLKENGAKISDILTMTIDLKATDGTREYGFYETRIGLLTLEQYGKYQHIIPDAEEYWWLATPWRTPGEKCGNSGRAWSVNSDGNAVHNHCSYTGYYLRPALMDKPDRVGEKPKAAPHLQRGLYPFRLLRVEEG